MADLHRIDQFKQQVDALAESVESLRRELEESGNRTREEPGYDDSVFLASYLALAPRIEEDALLTMLLRCAMHAVNGSGAGLTLLDREKNKLVFKAAIGDGADGILGYEVPLEGSMHGLAFASRDVQSSTPLHSEIESNAGTAFRNVLVAPLLADDEGVGTMSAVNKKNGDHFTPEDMEAYRLFADLAALVIRQRLREQVLNELARGKTVPEAAGLAAFRFSEMDTLLMEVFNDIVALSRSRQDLLPLCKRLTTVLVEMSHRIGWDNS